MRDYNIDKNSPIPLYYQLKTELIKDIEEGQYPIGSEIPTENEFIQTLHLSRTTVRQAILALVNEGYLERATSKGTTVLSAHKSINYIKSFTPFYQQMAVTGKKKIRTNVLSLNVEMPDSLVAEKLEISQGGKIIRLKRLRFADDIPMVVLQNYLPFDLCGFILSHNFEQESLFEVLFNSSEAKPGKTKTVCSALLADKQLSGLLKINENAPILCLENLTRTQTGKVVDYGFAHYRGDLNQFEIEATPQFK